MLPEGGRGRKPFELRKEDHGYDSLCWLLNRNPGRPHVRITIDNKQFYAHRWFYEQAHGEIPAGYDLHHLCGVPSCCNPDHLKPCTRLEHLWLEGKGKLTKADVREIRAARGLIPQKELAERYGVADSYISRIQTGIRRKDG